MRRRILSWCCYSFALTFLVFTTSARAEEHWRTVTTAHFEMYTTNSEKQAIRSLQGFEQVRYFFLKNSKGKQQSEDRVRIIAFSSEKAFAPYRPNAGTFAFYLRSHERDYIVMQDIEADHSQAAVHEYTHLIVQHMKLKLPTWLDEGLADLYSSLEPHGHQAMIGRPIAGRVAELSEHSWIDWNTIFQTDHDSPYYNERNKQSMFYAQSWVLTHMLVLGKDFSKDYPKFFAAVANGATTEDALRSVYGKSVSDIGKALQHYVREESVRVGIIDVELSKQELDPVVKPASPFQTELALAELESAQTRLADRAQRRLTELEAQNGGSAAVEEALGYLAWQQGRTDDAMHDFGLAFDHGASEPKMLFDYAQLLGWRGGAEKKRVEVLQKVVALNGQNDDARIQLAGAAVQAKQFSTALGALAPIHTVKPDQAFQFFAISAFVRANLKDYKAGESLANRASQYAKSDPERQEVQNLLHFFHAATQGAATEQAADAASASASSSFVLPLRGSSTEGSENQPSPSLNSQRSQEHPPSLRLERDSGLSRVHGTTKAFDCATTGNTPHLHVVVNGRPMTFSLGNPNDILVLEHGKSATLEWNCGRDFAEQTVTVVYGPATESKTDGVIAELIF